MKRTTFAALAGAALLALVGCTNGTLNNQAVATVAQDVAIIANGLKGALPALGTAGAIPADKLGAISQAIANLQTVSVTIAAAASTSAALPDVQQVEADVNAIVAALVGVPGLPQNVTLALVAAQVLLPVVETAVGMIVPPSPKAYAMTPNEARAILIGQSAR